jgi:hypothetical protein
MPGSLFPVLLAVHVVLALALVLPSILLPFALRAGGPMGLDGTSTSPIVRGLLVLQAQGSVVIGAGLLLTGIGLVSVLGGQLLSQAWLLVALAIYVTNLALAFFVQRPNLRRLVGWHGGDEATWRARARRQRYVSYGMALLVGTIAFLMSTKPDLW